MSQGTAYWLVTIAMAVVLIGVLDSGARDEGGTMDTGDYVTAEYVAGFVDSLPMLRFADGRVSLNDRCMVRQVKLNPKMPPVYVSGHPVGFC